MNRSTVCSKIILAISEGAAEEKLGLLPLRISANKVNWLTNNISPATSRHEKLNFPVSSEKIRRLTVLFTTNSISSFVSALETPTNIASPLPI